MGSTTSRALYLLALLALAALSLRPHAGAERALGWLLAPARVLGELARPLGWLRAREARAAEGALRELEAQEYAAREALERDQRRFALPSDPALLAGRAFVHAEVVGRVPGERDVALVRPAPADLERVRPGLPAAAGDAFVGRVRALRPAQGLVEVELVTRQLVGAHLVPDPLPGGAPARLAEPARMVVGGVLELEDGAPLLQVHSPSRRAPPPGVVVVDEGFAGAAPYPELAAGFVLGRLVARAGDEEGATLAVRPLLDYAHGLFEVVLVTPPEEATAPAPALDVLREAEAWVAASALSCGDPSSWREGLKLDAGGLRGVRAGAAVVFGARLVGRVRHAAPLWSDVAALGDPGATLTLLARVEGRERPLPLGLAIVLGRGVEGDPLALRLAWIAQEDLAAEGKDGGAAEPLAAELFTGSGEPLVPRGLYVGRTLLPRGPGRHELVVRQSVDPRPLRRAWVRTALPAAPAVSGRVP